MQKYRRLIFIGLFLGLLAFIAVALLSDVRELAKYATTFPWLIMIPALLLRVANWFLRFLKWHYYLRLVGVPPFRWRDSGMVFVTGFPLAASPGKAAEILKSFILKNLTGTAVATTLPVVAAERLSDGMAVLILFGLAILLMAKANFLIIAIPASLAILILIFVVQNRSLCLSLLARLKNMPMIGKYARSFELFYESSYKIVLLPNMVVAVGLGLIANLLDAIGVYLILLGLGQPATMEVFLGALMADCLAVIAGSVSGSPGGIGAADLTLTGTLIGMLGDPAKAGFATLLIRFVQLWWGVMVGGAVAFLNRERLFPPSLETVIEEEHAAMRNPVAAGETI